MAVRIQVRRGTSTQWNNADPVLNEGEIGYNSTLGQIKIGDGTSIWSVLDYMATDAQLNSSLADYIEIIEKGAADGVAELNADKNVLTQSSIIFEGATTNSYQTTVTVVDPTGDNTVTIPNITGTVITSGDTGTVTNAMLAGSIANEKLSNSAITINGQSVSLGGSVTLPGDISGVTAGTGLTGGGTSGDVTLSIDSTVVTISGVQTLTSKTLTSPIVTGLALNDSSIVFEGSTEDTHETTLTVTNPTADRTITLPDNSGTVITTGDAGTVTSTMIANGTIVNEDINVSAAIDKTKISGTAITAADTGTVTSTMIADGTIIDGDINVSANIAVSKLAANTISGVTLGNNLNALTIGGGLSGTSYNGSTSVTVAIDSTVSTTSGAQTLTNKTIALGSNTVSGTLAEFNTALTDGDFASIAGAETLTNKTLGTSTALGANLSAATYKITNLGAPTDSTDAATKAYVDGVTEGLHIHASVVAATTANINLSTDVEAGDTLDSVTLAEGNRILVKNQTTQSQNGIYIVATTGAPSRAADFDTPAEIDGGDFVFVTGGFANDNTGWVQTEVVTTVGTDPIIFTQFSGAGTYQAGNGLSLNGGIFSINTIITADVSTAQTLTNKTIALGNNTVSGTIADFNTALTDADFATLAGSETFSNKTLTSPIITGLTLNDSSIVFEGSSADSFETTLTVINPTVDRTITFPDATGTVALQGFIPAGLTWGDLKNGKSA